MATHPATLISAVPPVNDVLTDSGLQALLSPANRHVQRARQVFTNRNLRLGNVEAIGFDMDYTLAIYHKRSIEQLSFDLTLRKLVHERGYPADVADIRYDHGFVMRGLAVDRA
ncbi:MAG: 5'-nucleotidase domain-containing protein, partial [Myxococcales bacterium]